MNFSKKDLEKGRAYNRNFVATEAAIARETERIRQISLSHSCGCGAEQMFDGLSEDELKAAIKATVLQILFFSHINYDEKIITSFAGCAGHMFYALFAKQTDVLNDSVING